MNFKYNCPTNPTNYGHKKRCLIKVRAFGTSSGILCLSGRVEDSRSEAVKKNYKNI